MKQKVIVFESKENKGFYMPATNDFESDVNNLSEAFMIALADENVRLNDLIENVLFWERHKVAMIKQFGEDAMISLDTEKIISEYNCVMIEVERAVVQEQFALLDGLGW